VKVITQNVQKVAMYNYYDNYYIDKIIIIQKFKTMKVSDDTNITANIYDKPVTLHEIIQSS
jgi:hypothetical protein